MIWLRNTALMRKYVNLLRYDKGKPLPFLLSAVTVVLVLSNLSMVLIKETDNIEKCFLAAKDILTILIFYSCIIKRFLNPEDSIRVTRLIEEEFLIDGFQIVNETEWKKIKKHYDKRRNVMQSSSQTIIVLIQVAYLGMVMKYLFLELLGASSVNDPRGYPTPLVSFIPSHCDSFFIYIYALHSLLIVIFALEGFSVYVSLLLGVNKIITDFEMIYILLDEIGNDYPGFNESGRVDVGQNDRMDNLGMERLRKYLRVIVHYHQNLNRNFNDCAAVSGYGLLMISLIIAIDTCFNIYLVLQAQDPKIFMNYIASCFCNNSLMLLCYYSGQRISNQNEILRRCLADLPWANKPQWFKQSMLIMMTRANVDTEINPYGVFVLNLMSYTDLTKAAFSFGNILYRRKRMDK